MKVNIANRLQQVEEYYFSTKLKEIAALQAKGENIVNLGIGKPDLAPPALIIDALKQESMKPDAHGYQSYKGIPEFRQAIANFYDAQFQVQIDPQTEILPLMGSKEGIMHLSMAFLNPGDEVLVPNPGYPSYAGATKLTGANIKYYDLVEENDYQINIGQLNELSSERTKIIWVNYPHMPTGALADREKLQELIFWAKARNIIVASDSPYAFILNEKPASILSLEGASECCIELNSLSKSHGMSGWRVGMAVGRQEIVNAMLRFKSNMDSGMFRPIQVAAITAMGIDNTWYERTNRIYRERRELLWAMLGKINFTFDTKSAGLFVWARISEKFQSGEEASDFLLARCKVFAPPGMIFGSNGEKYVRFSLCQPKEVIDEACRRIITVINY